MSFFFYCCSLVSGCLMHKLKISRKMDGNSWLCMHFWKEPYLGRWLLLLLLLWTLLARDGLRMLRMHMMVGVEGLWRRVKPLQGSEGAWDEFWGQWVEDVGLLELKGLQLCLDLLKGDAMKAWVFMADGDKVLPEFSEKKKKRKQKMESFTYVFLLYFSLSGLSVSLIILLNFPCWRCNKLLSGSWI